MSEVLENPEYARAKKFNSTDGIKEFLEKGCEAHPMALTPLRELWLAYLLYWDYYTPEDYLNNHPAYVRFSMNLHKCLSEVFFTRHSRGVKVKAIRPRPELRRRVQEINDLPVVDIPVADR